MIRKLDQGLWEIHQPRKVAGIELGVRSTLVRLQDGTLWMHSPVELDRDVRSLLENEGRLRVIVAPNLLHHLYLAPYFTNFPDAEFYCPSGLRAKRSELPFSGDLAALTPEQSYWRNEIDMLFVDGIPVLNEFVFFHHASRTLIVTDLLFNLPKQTGLWPRIFCSWNLIDGQLATSRLVRKMVRNPSMVNSCMQKILAWRPVRIVMAHGDVVMNNGTVKLSQSLHWLNT